jgi:hypothetical protein
MLPEPLRSVIVGSLLGDACLERNGRHWRLRFDHGWREEAYAWWKFRLLHTIAASTPRWIEVRDRRTGRIYRHVRFDSRSIPELEAYAGWFYEDGRKRVPPIIDMLLTSSLALAVWYMDDGHRRADCRALRLNTQGFLCEEVDLLIRTLHRNFGIAARRHRVKANQWVIYLPVQTAQRFCDLIRPHIPPEMGYKLL